MGVVNRTSGTRVDEIAEAVYRISTPVPPSAAMGGFSFNQYLLVDEAPLLFHTGPRGLFPLVREAVEDWLRRRGGRLEADQFVDPDHRRWNLPATAACAHQ